MATAMAMTLGDPTNYLSLALDARKAVNALREFSKTGVKSPELLQSLTDAVHSLNALQGAGGLFTGLHAPSTYEYYEQIKTLQEVQQAMGGAELVTHLSTIISGPRNEGRKQAALAVRFFVQLENRAMQRFNQASSLSR